MIVTVLEIIQRSSEYLARKGVESPRLQIELLLAHLLQMPRLKLYLNFNHPLNQEQLDTLRQLVQRRGAREPLQQILGSACFCGLELIVTPEVLVPRPETELLAERAWEFLRQRAGENGSASLTVLDFGTGSGCLAVTLAAKVPQAQVHAVDISEAALNVARQNATRHGVAERIYFHVGDGLAALPSGLQFDLLVSNPPYIPTGEIINLEPEVRDHEPRAALDGGVDGLEWYRRLALEGPPLLVPEGRLLLEFGDGQEEAIRAIFLRQSWSIDAVEADHSKRPRIIIAHRAV